MTPPWLGPALDYAERWLSFQRESTDVPGIAFAAAHDGVLLREFAVGYADLSTRLPLTPRHRFRAASLSKTVTALALMRLVGCGKVGLDDSCGGHVPGLHPDVARAKLRELLSHSAGLAREGPDASFFAGVRPFPTDAELTQLLLQAPTLAPGSRCKYSNLGYALLGRVIAEVAALPLNEVLGNVLRAADLRESVIDADTQPTPWLASGHSARQPAGVRFVLPGDGPTASFASATGLIATVGDLARLYAQVGDPSGDERLLAPALRMAMRAEHARDPSAQPPRSYGLGLWLTSVAGWQVAGHLGRYQGTTVRAAVLPELGVAVAIASNAADAPVVSWTDGVIKILRTFADRGEPSEAVADWSGRWWSLYGAIDLVPAGQRVLACDPSIVPPLTEVTEISLDSVDQGQVVSAPATERLGERVSRKRDSAGMVSQIQIGGARLLSEAAIESVLRARFNSAATE